MRVIHDPGPVPGEIVRACRVATAHNHGRAVLEAVASERGVRVRLSSWPRQQEALRDLWALGYAAVPDSRPIGVEHGEAVLVTGWDWALLTNRVTRLETAIRDMTAVGGRVAADALDSYRLGVDELGLHDGDARRRAVEGARGEVARAPGRVGHVSAPVDPADLDRAAGELRRLLARVAAAETALSRMERDHAAVADAVIGLFLEYRDVPGYVDEELAAAKALAEVGEGLGALRELAGAETDPGGWSS